MKNTEPQQTPQAKWSQRHRFAVMTELRSIKAEIADLREDVRMLAGKQMQQQKERRK
jgi:hypothetical protein